MRSNPNLTADILVSLKKAGLVIEDPPGSFRYAPETSALADVVCQLDEINAERPLAIIKEIISAPNDKIISFVDAFKLKKDKD